MVIGRLQLIDDAANRLKGILLIGELSTQGCILDAAHTQGLFEIGRMVTIFQGRGYCREERGFGSQEMVAACMLRFLELGGA